jgi:lia operon protein LiaG
VAFALVFVNYGDRLPFFGSDDQTKEVEVTKDIESIEIDVESISTTVIPSDNNRFEAELQGKGKLNISQSNDSIELKVNRKWFDWFSFFDDKNKLTIYLPENYDRDMDIKVGSGNFVFEGQSEEKPMTLSTLSLEMSSGNVELENFVTKEFDHEGSSGRISIHSLKTDKGSFDISSGKIDLRDYEGPLDADLSSGRLNAQLNELNDAVNIKISSGSVDLDLPDNADFTLNGKVSSGDISSEFPLTNHTVNKKDISGKHGKGTHPINLKVSSGNIDIH